MNDYPKKKGELFLINNTDCFFKSSIQDTEFIGKQVRVVSVKKDTTFDDVYNIEVEGIGFDATATLRISHEKSVLESMEKCDEIYDKSKTMFAKTQLSTMQAHKADKKFRELGITQFIDKPGSGRRPFLKTFKEQLSLTIGAEFDGSRSPKTSKLKDFCSKELGNSSYARDIPVFGKDLIEIKHEDVTVGVYSKQDNIVYVFIDFEYFTSIADKAIDIVISAMQGIPFEVVDVKKRAYELVARQLLGSIESRIASKRSTSNNLNCDLQELQKNIQKVLEDRRAVLIELEALENSLGKDIDLMQQKIEDIKTLKIVDSVSVSEEGLIITTTPITYKWKVSPGETLSIPYGKFDIILSDRVRIFSQEPVTIKNRLVHHPHVTSSMDRSGNNICFGGHKETVNELFAEKKLKELVYYICVYLNQYNANDRYEYIENIALAKGIIGNTPFKHRSGVSISDFPKHVQDQLKKWDDAGLIDLD